MTFRPIAAQNREGHLNATTSVRPCSLHVRRISDISSYSLRCFLRSPISLYKLSNRRSETFSALSIFTLRVRLCPVRLFCIASVPARPLIPNQACIDSSTMCIQVVERYSVCRCLYYRHAVDPCSARAQRGHAVQEKTVLVGYACESHSRYSAQPSTQRSGQFPDSGYSSGGFTSHHEK
jgi:hypothetical protein